MASHRDRRAVLGGLAVASIARPAWALDKVSFRVPDGACDCHHHVYDPSRWAYAPTAVIKPPPATLADYRRYQARIGTSRSVAVTPSTYAFNNDCTADFLKAQGARAVGVAVVPADVDAGTLKSLHAAGFRGVRVQSGGGNPLGPDAMMPLAKRIAPLGWHMQLNLTAPLYAEHQDMILKLPVTVVVDHMAGIPGQEGVESPAYTALRRFIDAGKTWVKLSGPDSGSRSGPPGYADRVAIARALVTAAPERCVWGSNWPFPSSNANRQKPDEVLMLDIVKSWAPDEQLRHRILVENPEALYGFDPRHRPAPPKS